MQQSHARVFKCCHLLSEAVTSIMEFHEENRTDSSTRLTTEIN